MSLLWNTIIFNPIINILVGFYNLTGNLGVSIIIFTILIKFVLIPVMAPAMKMRKKQQELQPEILKLKKKYGNDKQKLGQAQMELYKKHGVNPTSGCLSPILMIIVMIGVYRAVSTLANGTESLLDVNNRLYFDAIKFIPEQEINKQFLYLDLSKPDPYYVFTGIAVIVQFIAGLLTLPETKTAEKQAENTKGEADDIMASMQKQNIYMAPFMFLIFGLTLPSGVMLYIIVSTAFQAIQTYFYTGLGGLEPWINKLKFGKVIS